jgi:enolase
VYQTLKLIIKEKYGQDSINVGDEGGFAPNILQNDEGLSLVVTAINKAGYEGLLIFLIFFNFFFNFFF